MRDKYGYYAHWSERLEEDVALDWYDGPIFRRGFHKGKEYYFIQSDLGWDVRGYWHEEVYWEVGGNEYRRVRIHYGGIDYPEPKHYLMFDIKHKPDEWEMMCFQRNIDEDAGYCWLSNKKYRPVGSRVWLERTPS